MRFAPGHRAWVVLAAVLLASCANKSAGVVDIDFWTIGREGEAMAKLVPAFEREHPGIRVHVQQMPLTAAHQKLFTAYAGNSMPDITQLGNTWLPEMQALNAIEPLDGYVAASKVVDKADYFPSIWATNTIDGRLWGVPWYVDTRLLFYRVDILKEVGFDGPPHTWDEWRRQLAAIRARGDGKGFAILLPTNEYEPLMSLALQSEQPLLRDGGRYGNFRSEGFKRALAFYVDTFKAKQAPTITNVEAGNPWTEFGRGVYAFYLSGPWNIGEFRKRIDAKDQDDWSTAALPGVAGPGASNAGGSSLVIFRTSKHKQEAWELVEFLSRPDIQRQFYDLLGDMPPRRSSWEGGTLANDPKARAFRDQLERVVPSPAVPEWERIATEMQLVAAEAVAGQISIDDAAAEIDRRTDRILEKRRWVLDHAKEHAP